MKIINLEESQFRRLVEGIENYGESNVPENQDQEETVIQSKMYNYGDVEDSDPIDTDKFSHIQTPQQWGTVGGRNASNTI